RSSALEQQKITTLEVVGVFSQQISKDSQTAEMREEALQRLSTTANWIRRNESRIEAILKPIAGARSIRHEIDGAMNVLESARAEVTAASPAMIDQFAVFHSSNALLYEYTLHCLIPTLFSRKVVVRPSSRVATPTIELSNLLVEAGDLPIECRLVTQ